MDYEEPTETHFHGLPFAYAPLHASEIRLLRLLSGTERSEVTCELIHLPWLANFSESEESLSAVNRNIGKSVGEHYLLASTQYEALSYTWDNELVSSDLTVPITLNGFQFRVTANLESALRHLRHRSSLRTLWIDAVCINQADTAEKEQQVREMHKIYDQAVRVIVWLGPESLSSNLAMKFINEIYRCFDPHDQWVDDEQHFHLLDTPQRIRTVQNLLKEEYAPSWVSLHQLLSRRWWGRAWILQELIVAKEAIVYCGSLKVPWSMMNLAIFTCRDTYHLIHAFNITVETPDGVHQYEWPSQDLELCFDILARRSMRLENDPRTSSISVNLSTWLSGNRDRSCRFPHDKIFSILGLLGPVFQDAIHPDYNQSIKDLYKTVVHMYVRTSKRLNLICHAQHSIWHPGQPSWMPDWGHSQRAVIFAEIPLFELQNSPLFDIAIVSFSEELNTLTVRGTCVGKVQKAGIEFSMLEGLRKQRWSLSGLCTNENMFSEINNRHEEEDIAWWYFESTARKLFQPALEVLASDDPEWGHHLNLLFEMIGLQLYPSNSDWHSKQSDKNKSSNTKLYDRQAFDVFYSHLQGLLKSRTIFETSEQEIGVALDFIRQEDWVCMLFGCPVPVILRRRKDGSFLFLGDAYLYLTRDGDLIRDLEEERCTVRNFAIC